MDDAQYIHDYAKSVPGKICVLQGLQGTMFSKGKFKSFSKIILIIAIILLLAGCSTTPVSEGTASQIPLDRVVMPSYIGKAVNPNDATILFLRDSGLLGGGCGYNLYIDFRLVCEIREGEQVTVHVPAGRHVFEYEAGGICEDYTQRQDTIIGAGEREVYRIHIYGIDRIK